MRWLKISVLDAGAHLRVTLQTREAELRGCFAAAFVTRRLDSCSAATAATSALCAPSSGASRWHAADGRSASMLLLPCRSVRYGRLAAFARIDDT